MSDRKALKASLESPPTSSPTSMPAIPPTSSPTSKPAIPPTSPPMSSPTIMPAIPPTSSPTSMPTIPPTSMPTIPSTIPPNACDSVYDSACDSDQEPAMGAETTMDGDYGWRIWMATLEGDSK